MIVLVEVHAMIGIGREVSDTPIPNIAYVVSDEGSISRLAIKHTRPIRQSKARVDESGVDSSIFFGQIDSNQLVVVLLLLLLVTNMQALGKLLEKKQP